MDSWHQVIVEEVATDSRFLDKMVVDVTNQIMEVIAKAGYPTNAEIFRTNDSTENDGSVGFFLSPPASELLKDKLSSLDAKLCEKPDTSVLKRVHPKCTS